MGTFTAAPHHDVLILIVQIAVLLLAARAFGEVSQRLGQPSVVGEILAGIVLGPSLLSGAIPALGAWIIPQTEIQGYLLEVVSLLGVMFLLLITGLETDIALIRQRARMAAGASIGGIVLPFATGLLLGWYLPSTLLVSEDHRVVFALFVATALSISAIPVIAKVLIDMNLIRRDIGQTILAAGMTDDAIGWILLSVVAGLAAGAGVTVGSVLGAVGSVLAFMIFSFTVGRWLVKRSLDLVQDEVISRDRLLTLVVVLTFVWGGITHGLNLEAVLGAFFMGILFGTMPRLPGDVVHKLESIALGIFAPIFFAVAGLKVNVRGLLTPTLMGIALVVIAIACFGKIVGTYVGARMIGKSDHWTALALGAGMNARGSMEIIVATIGLQLGILTQDMFSIIVLMAIVTSLMAPPALRWALNHVVPEQQELDRLRREELNRGSKVAAIHRVLLPVRRRAEGNPVHRLEAALLERLAGQGAMSLTLLNVTEPGGQAKSTEFLDQLTPIFPAGELTRKVVESSDPAGEILREAQKDYDLLIFGATEGDGNRDTVFHPLVDQLVRLAPCPTLVVKDGTTGPDWKLRRILVPTNGSAAARQAAELAFRMVRPGEEVVVLSVARTQGDSQRVGLQQYEERHIAVAREIVDELRELGEAQGARVVPLVRTAPEPEDLILQVADEVQCGLILLGTDVRPGSGRLFLGPRVEHILGHAPCPVLVYNAP